MALNKTDLHDLTNLVIIMQKKGLFFISDYRDVTCKPVRDPSYWILKALDKDNRFNVYSTANRIIDSSCFGNIKFLKLNYKGNIQIQKPGYNYAIHKVYKKNEDKVKIIHHCEKFQLGKGYNLIPLLSKINGKTLIIGPIQLPHDVFLDDFLVGSEGFVRLLKKFVYLNRNNFEIILKCLFKRTIKHADKIIVPDKEVKKELSNYVLSSKIEIINYGVDLSNYRKFKYGADGSNYNIVYAGAALKRKGVEYLLNAIPSIKKHFPEVKLHLLSNGYKIEEYEKLSKDLDITENVVFHGRLENDKYLELLSKSRLLCLPTLSEGYSWTILDAMCLGVPVVTTYECRCNDLFEDGNIGLRVNPGDSKALAESIIKLFDNFELCKKFSENGLKKRKNYDYDNIMPKYVELYKRYF